MPTITFIPKISKATLQKYAKDQNQALTDLINKALEEYLNRQEELLRKEQQQKIQKFQQKINKLVGSKGVNNKYKNIDLDDLMAEEFEEQLNRIAK